MHKTSLEIQSIFEGAGFEYSPGHRSNEDVSLVGPNNPDSRASRPRIERDHRSHTCGGIVIDASLIQGSVERYHGIAAKKRNGIRQASGRGGESIKVKAALHR
jgi:hypothetical protein